MPAWTLISLAIAFVARALGLDGFARAATGVAALLFATFVALVLLALEEERRLRLPARDVSPRRPTPTTPTHTERKTS